MMMLMRRQTRHLLLSLPLVPHLLLLQRQQLLEDEVVGGAEEERVEEVEAEAEVLLLLRSLPPLPLPNLWKINQKRLKRLRLHQLLGLLLSKSKTVTPVRASSVEDTALRRRSVE